MKFSQYNVRVDVKEGIVLYNSKIGQYVNIFNPEDIKHFEEIYSSSSLPNDDYMVKALYERSYIVDDDTDEYSLVKAKIEDFYHKRENIFSALIYVTEK